MKKSKVTATIALIAVSVSTLALVAGPASAWTHRRHVGFPPFSALNFYSSPRHPHPLLQWLWVRRLPVPPQHRPSNSQPAVVGPVQCVYRLREPHASGLNTASSHLTSA